MEKRHLEYMIFILKGITLSYIITIITMLILSIFLTYTSLKESIIPILNTIIMIGSIVLGSVYLTSKVKNRGWLNGMIIGILYFLVLLLLNRIIIKEPGQGLYMFYKLLISIVTGIIGGMIGINLS